MGIKERVVNLRQCLLVASIMPFILVVVSPLTFYLGNHSEYTVNISEVVSYSLLAFMALTITVFAIVTAARKIPGLWYIFTGLLLGLSASVWIQSQIFIWDFGPLDGRGIEWQRWNLHAYGEVIVWLCIIVATLFLTRKSKKTMFTMAQGILLLGILSLVNSWVSSDYETKQLVAKKSSNAFSFHAENNKILIVLDTFQSDIFNEIANRWPEEVEFLEGFVFLPNTVGGYPTTQASIPLVLTGDYYKNEIPIKEWTREKNSEGNIADYHAEKGWGVDLVSSVPDTLDGVKSSKSAISSLGEQAGLAKLKNATMVMDGGFFRSLPTIMKPGFYDEGNWFFAKLSQPWNDPPGSHGADLRFIRAFEKYAAIGSGKKAEFKYYHLRGAHWPLQINEVYEYIENMPGTRESYVSQSRGVLTLLKRIFGKLKSLGLYDSSEIIVIGDHGSHGIIPADIRGDENADDYISHKVLASSRPLFLYKKSGAEMPLLFSDAPAHLDDVVCLLSNQSAEFRCDGRGLFLSSNAIKRTFLYYDWTKEYGDWSREYMPPMHEYIVRGDVRDISAWHSAYIEYAKGNVRKLPRAVPYKVGNIISFSLGGNAKQYTRRGWSDPEPTHRWTDAPEAAMRIELQSTKGNDLLLRMDASAYLGGGIPHQDIAVVVNGSQVAVWQVAGWNWYEAHIPAGVVEDGVMEVVFVISDPTAPCEVSDSKDCRKLGIAAREMVIDYAE